MCRHVPETKFVSSRIRMNVTAILPFVHDRRICHVCACVYVHKYAYVHTHTRILPLATHPISQFEYPHTSQPLSQINVSNPSKKQHTQNFSPLPPLLYKKPINYFSHTRATCRSLLDSPAHTSMSSRQPVAPTSSPRWVVRSSWVWTRQQ